MRPRGVGVTGEALVRNSAGLARKPLEAEAAWHLS